MRNFARDCTWPAFVGLSLAGYLQAYTGGWWEIAVFVVPAVGVIALLAVELVLPARPGHSPWADPERWRDIAHNFGAQVAGAQLGEIFFVATAALVAGAASGWFGGNLWPVEWPVAVQIALVIVIADGLESVRHRLSHSVEWLWPMHALHHSADVMHVLKSGRGHGLDMLGRTLFVFAPLVALGAPGHVLLWYPAAIALFGPIAHSNVATRVPRWLHWLVLTPGTHLIHHARDPELARSNFVNVVPVWDVLFGTFRHPDDHRVEDFGIENDPVPSDFVGQLLHPFTCWWDRARSSRAQSRPRTVATKRSRSASPPRAASSTMPRSTSA